MPADGPIPGHLTKSIVAHSLGKLAKLVKPYPDKPDIDVTDAMKEKGWTPKIMFQKADDFFQSMGMEPMTDVNTFAVLEILVPSHKFSDFLLHQVFWEKSLIERPTDGREVVCHATAWDFYAYE